MKGYHANIEEVALDNNNFRKVLFTGKHTQLVVMCLKAGEDIGEEVHEHVDQFFRIESGKGEVYIDEEVFDVQAESVVIVPAGAKHNVVNTHDSDDLKLYTLYSPPNHPEGTIHETREEAVMAEKEHQP
ncbi:cupin [Candidatus Woesebacteria bacterium RIFCSPHIGHO2_01_FULL_41_10]|uniref:Cupin n=1 Tax=Candidatus Woesebacteria bacterium RIFCSPHIGHO2_01_FULL_41_10 TaxID=1802500 RepID=A0A1F7YNK0_9BACT|nr:MAG: cupin [Candidatus Woesebacteria bacterium RIFCSPHIGHO2_01_FULL_41_10]